MEEEKKKLTENEIKAAAIELQSIVSTELRKASWDSFIIALGMAFLGVQNIMAGDTPVHKAVGAIEIFVSLLNAFTGSMRRDLAKMLSPKE